MPSTTDSSSSQFYQHITDLPLSRFVDITTSGVLYPLIISGSPSQEELSNAWDAIIAQYSEHMGNGEQQVYLSLYKDINKLSFAIEEVKICVNWLRKGYNGELVTRLNRVLNTIFVFDRNNEEEYFKNLQKALNRSKGFKITLDIKLSQFEAIRDKQETEGAKPTKEYYQSILLTLGSSDHVFFEADKISVYQFCELIKRWNRKMEQAQKK